MYLQDRAYKRQEGREGRRNLRETWPRAGVPATRGLRAREGTRWQKRRGRAQMLRAPRDPLGSGLGRGMAGGEMLLGT